MEDGEMREEYDQRMVERVQNPLDERAKPERIVGARPRPSRVEECIAHAKLLVQRPVEQSESQWLRRREQNVVCHQT